MKKKTNKAAINVSDPGQLYDYVKITNPGMWILLLGCLFAIIALIFNYLTNEITDGMKFAAVCDDGKMSVFVGEDDLEFVKRGMDIVINGRGYHVTTIEKAQWDDLEAYYMYIIDRSAIDHGETIYYFQFDTQLDDGTYTAEMPIDQGTASDYMLKGI